MQMTLFIWHRWDTLLLAHQLMEQHSRFLAGNLVGATLPVPVFEVDRSFDFLNGRSFLPYQAIL